MASGRRMSGAKVRPGSRTGARMQDRSGRAESEASAELHHTAGAGKMHGFCWKKTRRAKPAVRRSAGHIAGKRYDGYTDRIAKSDKAEIIQFFLRRVRIYHSRGTGARRFEHRL